jgi:ion channel-forming bestrophin family protein
MIIKSVFNPLAVARYMKTELLLTTLISCGVYGYFVFSGGSFFALPFAIAAIMGSALAIFIGFRNNSSYARWWEARTQWSMITQSTRVLSRLVCTFTDSHKHQQNYVTERSEEFKKTLCYMIIAWAHALRMQLRGETSWEKSWNEVRPLLAEEDFRAIQHASNKPNVLQLLMGKRIYEAMANGTLGGFDSFQMEGQLAALANYQAACERIKHTPLLRQYHYFTKVFLIVFMVLLPLCLIGDFARNGIAWASVPVSILISFVFGVMGKVGEVNENPFENQITDVPLSALCNRIERDVRETLGETHLPTELKPHDGFLM